jgi:hypothetical protein
LELALGGGGELTVDVTFMPGAQVGLRIPNIGQHGTFAMWMSMDSHYQANLHLDIGMEAKVTRAKDEYGSALEEALSKQSDRTEQVLNDVRERFMNDPDMKPAGGWKRTLLITKPATQVVMAGPVPVVFTQTFQLDLECGFEVKAGFKAKMAYTHTTALRFSTRYESGKVSGHPPSIESRKDSQVEVTGGGGLSISCGLIPRINVFVYDTTGLSAGVRGSLVARADYGEKCDPGSLSTPPKPEVTLALNGNFGVQVGGRLQTPGSSYAQKDGLASGFDVGPLEVWNKEVSIYSHVWSLEGGLGSCMPSCRNTCGGRCPKCAVDVRSAVAAECGSGVSDGRFCVAGTCWDRVLSGEESDIDCGGPMSACKRCDEGQKCGTSSDCSASAPVCDRATHVCSPPRCSDSLLNGDETGVDCGGSCPECGAPIDESALRRDLRGLTQRAHRKLIPLGLEASPGPAAADFVQDRRVPDALARERLPTGNNMPASWTVQSEVLGGGVLETSSSHRQWNQALIPVIHWGSIK